MNKVIQLIEDELSIIVTSDYHLSFSRVNLFIDKALENHICFYKQNGSTQATTLFNDRAKQSKSKIIFTNGNYKEIKNKLIIKIESTKFLSLQKKILDIINPLPKNKKYIGITGTNGKTTTSTLVSEILRINNIDNILIGTNGIFNTKKELLLDLSMTSPSYPDLRYLF